MSQRNGELASPAKPSKPTRMVTATAFRMKKWVRRAQGESEPVRRASPGPPPAGRSVVVSGMTLSLGGFRHHPWLQLLLNFAAAVHLRAEVGIFHAVGEL